jgi:acetyl-CoA carboxylase biotin carboxylase subunit
MVTGIDLVRQQIMIAAGGKITMAQDDIAQRGHAIEARIYAEDPENNFLPCPGKILCLNEPSGPGIRVDTGIYQGWTVPPHYDPILAKLVVWSENRPTAIKRMSGALENYIIIGIKTNLGYLKRVMDTEKFGNGDYHTHFIDDNESELRMSEKHIPGVLARAAMAIAVNDRKAQRVVSIDDAHYSTTPWQELGQWEICSH